MICVSIGKSQATKHPSQEKIIDVMTKVILF